MKRIIDYIKEALSEVNGFCILKPGFLEYLDEFCALLENNGWKIIRKQVMTLSVETAKELYKDKKDEDYYNDLCTYMSSGDCLCCMCHKECEDPIKDLKKLKDRVRKSWGIDDMKNAMHSSDSLENVNREYKLVFDNKII